MEARIALRDLQSYIRQKDHDPHRKLEYLQKLIEEVGELARAMRQGTRYEDTGRIKETLDEELYDVLYYVVAVANLYDVDLETAAKLKESFNARRYGQWELLPQEWRMNGD